MFNSCYKTKNPRNLFKIIVSSDINYIAHTQFKMLHWLCYHLLSVLDHILLKNQRLKSLMHSHDTTAWPKSLQLSPPGVTTSPPSHVQDLMFDVIPPHGNFFTSPRLDTSGLEATTDRAIAKIRRAIFMLMSLVFN